MIMIITCLFSFLIEHEQHAQRGVQISALDLQGSKQLVFGPVWIGQLQECQLALILLAGPRGRLIGRGELGI
jgi:hypothetical protein